MEKTDKNTPLLPELFTSMLDHLGLDGLAEVLSATEPVTSVRLNPTRTQGLTAGNDQVPWEPNGYYLAERPAFTFDPRLYQGLYYVQDASSMVTGHVVRELCRQFFPAGRPLAYLDLCAAPGGKTTAAISALPSGSAVVANEYEPDRVLALADNIERWGNPDVLVTRGDGTMIARARETFDIIAADVPCSGEGMMRKNATAVGQWSESLINECAALQRRLVEAAWSALKPGGFLIYSTCTFNRSENEENALWIRDELGGLPVDLGLSDFEGVMGAINADIPAARFIPGRIRGEGLFIAVFRKPGETADEPPKQPKKAGKAPKKQPTPVPDEIKRWIAPGYTLCYGASGESVHAMTETTTRLQTAMSKAGFNLVRSGLTVATIKGGRPIPTQALATSSILCRDAFPNIEVDYPTAISFLRGEALRLPDSTPRSTVLLVYGGHPLGFVKNIGNRANNLLPAALRIKSSHIPDTPPAVLTPKP